MTHGLEVAGGVLPALGFALIMNMIRKEQTDSFRILRLYRSIRWRSKLINSWNHRQSVLHLSQYSRDRKLQRR